MAEAVLVGLPGTLCSPAVFAPVARALAGVLDRSFREPPNDEARAGFLAWAAAVSQQAAYDVLASQRDLDLTGELAGVRQPAIVIHGRYDRARPPEQGRELAGALPHAEFRLVETGHTPLYEAPAASPPPSAMC